MVDTIFEHINLSKKISNYSIREKRQVTTIFLQQRKREGRKRRSHLSITTRLVSPWRNGEGKRRSRRTYVRIYQRYGVTPACAANIKTNEATSAPPSSAMCLYPSHIRPRGAALSAENVLSPWNVRVAGQVGRRKFNCRLKFYQARRGLFIRSGATRLYGDISGRSCQGERGNGGETKSLQVAPFLCIYIFETRWNQLFHELIQLASKRGSVNV